MCRRIFKEQTSENGEIPFYKIGTFGGEADAFISRELFEEYKAKYQYPKKGDILISASGSIGRTVVFTGKNEYFQDSNIVWLNHDKHLDNSFLKCFYSIVKWAGIEGSTIKRLYNDNILNTAITLPSVEEQQKIGAYFENLDNLITLHQRKYDKLTNVKKSMLEKMFPQNGSNAPEIRFKGFTEAWEQRKVREVTDRYDNLRIPVAASLRVAGTTPYYGANGIQDYVDGYTHDGEFILVAEDGANDLKNYPVKCVKGRIWVNNHAHVLQGKYDCADNQFLAYAISQADIESLLVGGGRAKLNAETLMGIDLLLPNKAEQIRIGKYLAQLDNLITLHQREFAFLCKEKSKKFRYIKNAWEQRKLSEIATMHARIGWQNLRTSEFLDSGDYMLITGTDFIDGAVNFDTCHYVERERYEQDKHIQIRNGSILITKDGTLGKVAYIQGLTMPATLNAGVFNVEIKDENEVDNRYLFQYLKAPFLMDYVDKKATGGTIKHLNQNILVDFPVVLPHKAEQEKIGEYFLAIDHLITLHQREFAFLCKEKSKKFRYIKNAWEQRKLGDFGKATGGTSIESEFSEDGIYKVISIGSYSENSVYNDQGIRAIKSDKTSNRVLNRNDLTMILNDKTTSGNIIGRVLLIEESGIYVYNQRTERIEINLDEYDSVFLYEMLNAPNIREKIIKQAQGNTQIYVNWTAISLLKYMIPSKEEQVKIGEYLHSISNLITLHQRKPNFYTGGYYAE